MKKAKAKRARRLRGDAPDLLANDIERAGGQDARELGEMVAHRTRVGEKPIERDEGGNAGEERQECIERDARGNREHPILADLLVNSPENVLPPFDRHIAWGFGGAAAIALRLGQALGVAALERQLVLLCAGSELLPLSATRRLCSDTRLGSVSPDRTRLRPAAIRANTSPHQERPEIGSRLAASSIPMRAGGRDSHHEPAGTCLTITGRQQPMFPRKG